MVFRMIERMEDNREFVCTPNQWRVFTEVLDRPARVIPELARLFSEREKRISPQRAQRAQSKKEPDATSLEIA